MSQPADNCGQRDRIRAHALRALPASEREALEAHAATCVHCHEELGRARALVEAFSGWPTDVLRPGEHLWDGVLRRIGEGAGKIAMRPQQSWDETDWEDVGPGIACKLLGTDEDRARVAMLVRLAPGCSYPAHTHAGTEELHLLDGELWIDSALLRPGDYYRAEPGSSDERVWSETGCTCVLVASPADVLR